MLHRFYYSELSDNPSYDWSLYHERVAEASLPDSLIQYFSDSLAWVPSHNPALRMEDQMGLNSCGPTVLKSVGAQILYDILKAWSALFTSSPQRVLLSGEFFWVNGETLEDGAYEKLTFDRGELVSSLDRLAGSCLRVANSNDRAFLMHYGI